MVRRFRNRWSEDSGIGGQKGAEYAFKEVWRRRTRGSYGKQRVFFIGKNELIKNKKAANRPIDKIDIQTLKMKKEMKDIMQRLKQLKKQTKK